MRTTLTLDDQLARALKDLARRSETPFKEVVNATLRRGLADRGVLPPPRPYSLPTFALGEVGADLKLDKALALADRLEDEELARKMAMNK